MLFMLNMLFMLKDAVHFHAIHDIVYTRCCHKPGCIHVSVCTVLALDIHGQCHSLVTLVPYQLLLSREKDWCLDAPVRSIASK